MTCAIIMVVKPTPNGYVAPPGWLSRQCDRCDSRFEVLLAEYGSKLDAEAVLEQAVRQHQQQKHSAVPGTH